MNLPGYGEMIECPYNKMHQLLKSRVQTHLIKCRRNYPNVHKVQCPFNVTHLVNEPELPVRSSQPTHQSRNALTPTAFRIHTDSRDGLPGSGRIRSLQVHVADDVLQPSGGRSRATGRRRGL